MSAALATLLGVPIETVPYLNRPDWEQVMAGWMATSGVRPWVVEALPVGFNQCAIVLGMGPRGRPHAVVGDTMGLVHDPHPSRDGLVGEPDGFVVLLTV